MKQEIISKLEALVKEDISEEVFSKAEELKNEYVNACESLNHELQDKFIQEGGNSGDFVLPKDPLDSRFNELIHILSDRENKFKRMQRDEIHTKLATKKQVLDDLEKLVIEETNIGRAFQKFKVLQNKWNEAGSVPSGKYKSMQSIYARHVHNFYYNMKLSKDLKELDFKRNHEIRTALLSKIESLLQMDSIRGVERMLGLYRMEWGESGPTSLDTVEPLRTRYRELIGQVLHRIREHYQQRQKAEQDHLEAKKALLEQIQKLAEENFDTAKQWKAMNDTVEKILDEWKKIGYAPKGEGDKVWKDLRTALSSFYKKRREFFATQKASFKGNKEKKVALIERAKEIANAKHESWEEPTKQILQLQADWKEAGSVERSDETKLWKRFREACDAFFNAKRDSFKERDSEQLKNLEAKEELIKRIEAFQLTGKANDDVEKLKEFSNEWKNISHVPFKDKERIYTKYKAVLDAKYESLKLDGSQKHMLKFRNSVDNLAQSSNSGSLLLKERQNIKDKISKLQATISQYENNLGFFANSKNMGSLLKEAQDNLEKAKQEVELLKQKLKMISEAQQV